MAYESVNENLNDTFDGWSYTDCDGDRVVLNISKEFHSEGWLLLGNDVDVDGGRGQVIYPEDLEHLKAMIEKAQEYFKERKR